MVNKIEGKTTTLQKLKYIEDNLTSVVTKAHALTPAEAAIVASTTDLKQKIDDTNTFYKKLTQKHLQKLHENITSRDEKKEISEN